MGNRRERKAYRSGQYALTPEELDKVLLNVKDWREHALIALAVATGLRRGDVVRVKWADLDLAAGMLRFYEQKKRRTRTVYFGPTLAADLKKLRSFTPGPWVFPGRSEPLYGRGHMSSRSAWNVFNRALIAAGLEERPFHALRATCVKLCQAKGWSMAQTAEHVGDTVSVIEAHYNAPSDAEMRAIAREKPIL